MDPSEQNHSPVEKEAYAVVESLKEWRHFLLGRHFKLITVQQSVTFMYNNKHASKIKNDKIMRWRVELSCFKYDTVYRPGRDNKGPDTFTRMFCASVNDSSLQELHNSLCHPQSVSWILAEFYFNRGLQRLYTGTCIILQKTINGFLCLLIVFLKSKTYQLILKDVIKLNRNLR